MEYKWSDWIYWNFKPKQSENILGKYIKYIIVHDGNLSSGEGICDQIENWSSVSRYKIRIEPESSAMKMLKRIAKSPKTKELI